MTIWAAVAVAVPPLLEVTVPLDVHPRDGLGHTSPWHDHLPMPWRLGVRRDSTPSPAGGPAPRVNARLLGLPMSMPASGACAPLLRELVFPAGTLERAQTFSRAWGEEGAQLASPGAVGEPGSVGEEQEAGAVCHLLGASPGASSLSAQGRGEQGRRRSSMAVGSLAPHLPGCQPPPWPQPPPPWGEGKVPPPREGPLQTPGRWAEPGAWEVRRFLCEYQTEG